MKLAASHYSGSIQIFGTFVHPCLFIQIYNLCNFKNLKQNLIYVIFKMWNRILWSICRLGRSWQDTISCL